ncbi:MAG: hypothetical protein HY364_02705 [Candidatus Aenigmarchaeota archaeon]|nr:hypothetical protein [Candidatus Aenigmarchaeota archaeon]
MNFERIQKYYPIWTLIWAVVLVHAFNYAPGFLLPAVALLLVKDLAIDILLRYGSFPVWFEHAPLTAMITIVGIIGIFIPAFSGLVDMPTFALAALDTVIDVADDIEVI